MAAGGLGCPTVGPSVFPDEPVFPDELLLSLQPVIKHAAIAATAKPRVFDMDIFIVSSNCELEIYDP